MNVRSGFLRALLLPLIAILGLAGCSDADGSRGTGPDPTFEITFLVAVPAGTPAGDTVFVTGDFQGWDPGDPDYALTKKPDERWEILLDLPPGEAIEFKFTRGSWSTVEVEATGEAIPNRTVVPVDGQVHELVVAAWADL